MSDRDSNCCARRMWWHSLISLWTLSASRRSRVQTSIRPADGCHSNLPEAQGNFWSKSYGHRQRLSFAALIKQKQSYSCYSACSWSTRGRSMTHSVLVKGQMLLCLLNHCRRNTFLVSYCQKTQWSGYEDLSTIIYTWVQPAKSPVPLQSAVSAAVNKHPTLSFAQYTISVCGKQFTHILFEQSTEVNKDRRCCSTSSHCKKINK